MVNYVPEEIAANIAGKSKSQIAAAKAKAAAAAKAAAEAKAAAAAKAAADAKAAAGTGFTGSKESQVVPGDQTTDASGNTLYVQDSETGAWYNNNAFVPAYVKPVKPSDADTAEGKYTTSTDAEGNTVWTVNPGYQAPNKPATRSEAQIAADARASAAALLSGEKAAISTANARDTLGSLFRQMFGNDPKFAPDIKLLTNQLEGLMIKGASSLEITQEIRQSDSYDKRFPGMDLRAAAGMSAISEAEYITLEDNYRNTLRTSGLSKEFADNDALYAGLIAGDVSAAELQTRVALAETAANGADPAILTQIEQFYPEMLEGNRLVEYYLDPEGAVNLYEEERRQRAAGLSVATLRSVGQGLDVGMAEALERENIQTREIQSRLGQRRGLTDRLLGEEEALTASEIASGEFGLEAEQATKLRRRREERVAGFTGQTGVLTTNSGIKGLGAAT